MIQLKHLFYSFPVNCINGIFMAAVLPKNDPFMLFHYLKPSLRNLLKKKVITSINILGLSIGISAALVIYLIVQYDYSFDRYEPDSGRVYRIVLHGEQWDNAGVPVPL